MNVAMGLFAAGEIEEPQAAERVVRGWQEVRALCADEEAA